MSRTLMWLLAAVVVLRILIGQSLLNQYVGYTSGTGSVAGRFHPATYLLALIFVFYFTNARRFPVAVRRYGWRYLVAALLGAIAVLVALMNGGLNAAATVADVVVASAMAAYLTTLLDERDRTLLFRVILLSVALNLIAVVLERGMGRTIFPSNFRELYFRPRGFFDHPLVAGTTVCCTMWGVLRLGKRPAIDLAWSAALFMQVLLLGVRLPLVVATMLFMIQILKLGRRSNTGKVAAATLITIVPPAMFAIALWLGFLDRFIALGLVDDESAGSRFIAFDILSSLSKDELWHGVSNDDMFILLAKFNIIAIENSAVAYTIMAGIGVSILVHVAIVVAIFPALRRDIVFIGLTLAIFAGTIVFSAKTSAFMIYLLITTLVIEHMSRGRHGRHMPSFAKGNVGRGKRILPRRHRIDSARYRSTSNIADRQDEL